MPFREVEKTFQQMNNEWCCIAERHTTFILFDWKKSEQKTYLDWISVLINKFPSDQIGWTERNLKHRTHENLCLSSSIVLFIAVEPSFTIDWTWLSSDKLRTTNNTKRIPIRYDIENGKSLWGGKEWRMNIERALTTKSKIIILSLYQEGCRCKQCAWNKLRHFVCMRVDLSRFVMCVSNLTVMRCR